MFRTTTLAPSENEQKSFYRKMALKIADVNEYPKERWHKARRLQANNVARRDRERKYPSVRLPYSTKHVLRQGEVFA